MTATKWHITIDESKERGDVLRKALPELKDQTFFDFHIRFLDATVDLDEQEWQLPNNFLDKIIFEEVDDLLDREWEEEMYPETLIIAGNGASTYIGYDLRTTEQPLIAFPGDDEDYFDESDVLAPNLKALLQQIGPPEPNR